MDSANGYLFCPGLSSKRGYGKQQGENQFHTPPICVCYSKSNSPTSQRSRIRRQDTSQHGQIARRLSPSTAEDESTQFQIQVLLDEAVASHTLYRKLHQRQQLNDPARSCRYQ